MSVQVVSLIKHGEDDFAVVCEDQYVRRLCWNEALGVIAVYLCKGDLRYMRTEAETLSARRSPDPRDLHPFNHGGVHPVANTREQEETAMPLIGDAG